MWSENDRQGLLKPVVTIGLQARAEPEQVAETAS